MRTRWKLSLLNKWLSSYVAVSLLFAAAVSAQNNSTPPIPTWNGDGNVPQGAGDRKVFLTPDQHSVIILWPNPDGTASRRRFDLHNTIYPDLHVQMEGSSGSFRYRYDLRNGKQSKDSLEAFSVVIYQDPQVQSSSALWKGGLFSSTMLTERTGIPGAPPGLLVDWMADDNETLQPGEATNFTLITLARPGFASAATEDFPHLHLTDEWPEEILDQLGPVLDPKWIAFHFITLGPRYGPDDPATRIASDYIVGIQELVRIHRLEPSSPFVQEVLTSLAALSANSAARIAVTQKPHSEMEAEILNALQLCLNITYSGP